MPELVMENQATMITKMGVEMETMVERLEGRILRSREY